MCDKQLVEETRRRIDNHDYEAVFTGGNCFHFALSLHKKYGYKIRGIREGHDSRSLSHVWCQRESTQGIDIHGVFCEELLVRLANGGDTGAVCDVKVDEIQNTILAKGYPPEFEDEIFHLADWVVENHERFTNAKPSNDNLYAKFLNNIQGSQSGEPAA